MSKLLFIDLETTGLYPERNGIVQIAYIIDIDGEAKIKRNFDIIIPEECELNLLAINTLGSAINGNTDILDVIEEIFYGECRIPLYDALHSMAEDLAIFVNPFKKNKKLSDRYGLVGHNIKFDRDFLIPHWNKYVENRIAKSTPENKLPYFYFGALVSPACIIDTLMLAAEQVIYNDLPVPNLKLSTLCEYYNIEIKAHNALSDIEATRELYYHLRRSYV